MSYYSPSRYGYGATVMEMRRRFHSFIVIKRYRAAVREKRAPKRGHLPHDWQVWVHGRVNGDFHIAIGVPDAAARDFFLQAWPAAELMTPKRKVRVEPLQIEDGSK